MTETSGFFNLGIAPAILTFLGRHGFTVPTPIQEKSIPAGLAGKDLVGIAQTGTGKTLGFGIPALQHVLQKKGNVLVVLPTRELALQVHESLLKIGQPLGIRFAVLIGGASMGKQLSEIRRGANIVIGTPGRMIDHLDQKTLTLSQTNLLVLDEADRMLDMGFAPQLHRILQRVPEVRQTLLFSATMPPEIMNIARKFMKLLIQIEVAPRGTTVEKVTQEVFILAKDQKLALLLKLLNDYKGSVLVFTRTKYGAKKVAHVLRNAGHKSIEIHSNRSLNQRKEALAGFKTGNYRVLVATDIAARGIDVSDIEVVVNFDLPDQAEDYVHRIGRTARAGAKGHAISFATPDQRGDLRTIERLVRQTLPVSKLPDSMPAPAPMLEVKRDFSRRPMSHRPSGGRGSRPGGFRRRR